MPAADRTRSGWALAAEAALVGAIVLAPALLGGALAAAEVAVCALAGLALAFAALDASAHGVRLVVPALAAFPLLGALFCALQLVPLPPSLLGWVSPEAARLRDFALVPLGLSANRPVSLDPPATFGALAAALAGAGLIVAACRIARAKSARRRLFAAVALVGGATALVGLLHLALGATSLFGLYSFRFAHPPLVTPFANANHLAAYLILAGLLSTGLAVRAEGKERGLYIAATALCGAAVLLSLSVAGIAIYLAAEAGLLALLALRRRSGGLSGRRFAALVAALAGIAVALELAAGSILDSLAEADTLEKIGHSKIGLWPMFAHAALRFPVGMGRGAFALGFARYQSALPIFTFTHPENFVLQLAAELGVVPACALFAVAVLGARRLWRRHPSALELAALVGAFALVLHDLFDFALELPACAVALYCVLGALAARPEDPAQPSPRQNGWALLFAALPLLAILPSARRASEAEARVWAAAHEGAERAESIGKEEIDRHPADYLLYDAVGWSLASAASRAAQGTDAVALGRALAYYERALYLRPVDARTHLFTARAFAKLGRTSQALGEYRRALDGELPTPQVLGEALRVARGVDALADFVGDDTDLALQVSERLRGARREEEALGLEERMLALAPLGQEPLALLCDDGRLRLFAKDADGALARAQEVLGRAPDSVPGALLEAQALEAKGQRPDAIETLEKRVKAAPGSLELSFALARALISDGRPREAREALERSRPFVADSMQLSQLDAIVGTAYHAEGRDERALESFQLAARIVPSAASLYQVARFAEGVGRYDDALAAVREAEAMQGESGEAVAKAWIDRLGAESRAAEARRRERQLIPTAPPDAAP